MLKDARLQAIEELVNQKGTVKVAEIMERLGVSDMTVRRDLSELEEEGRLRRVHGGARSLRQILHEELSHQAKQIIHVQEKEYIARKALALIKEDETIFLGPGTTIEIMAKLLDFSALRIVTNCWPVFQILSQKKQLKVYLLGGEIRQKTQAFFGEITNRSLQEMHFHKTFFSCNGVKGNEIMTATIEEGQTQRIALENSFEKYLLIDSSKIDKADFYSYYQLSAVDGVITEPLEEELAERLATKTRLID